MRVRWEECVGEGYVGGVWVRVRWEECVGEG